MKIWYAYKDVYPCLFDLVKACYRVVLCHIRSPSQCPLKVNGNILQQDKTFTYLGMIFTNNGRHNR